MKGFGKFKISGFSVILAFFMAAYGIAVAENGKVGVEKTEVLTSLEQRMLKTISVDFRNTPIEDVIRIMADQADVDIVKSPTVTGSVTATLTNVPLEEALDNILTAHGYGYVVSKNMIRIAPMEEINVSAERLVNRVYRINYADVAEVEKALKKSLPDMTAACCTGRCRRAASRPSWPDSGRDSIRSWPPPRWWRWA